MRDPVGCQGAGPLRPDECALEHAIHMALEENIQQPSRNIQFPREEVCETHPTHSLSTLGRADILVRLASTKALNRECSEFKDSVHPTRHVSPTDDARLESRGPLQRMTRNPLKRITARQARTLPTKNRLRDQPTAGFQMNGLNQESFGRNLSSAL